MSDATASKTPRTAPSTPHLDALRDMARSAPSAEAAVAQIAALPNASRMIQRARIEETAEKIHAEQEGGQRDG